MIIYSKSHPKRYLESFVNPFQFEKASADVCTNNARPANKAAPFPLPGMRFAFTKSTKLKVKGGAAC